MTQAKGAIALAAVAGLIAILKMILQARAAREASDDKIKSDSEVAKLRREAEERGARHEREAEDREQEAEERKAEREQKEKLIVQLQESTRETLAILRNELAVRDLQSARSFEYLDRNTRATEKLAETAVSHAAELRSIGEKIASIQGGAGCRIDRRAS